MQTLNGHKAQEALLTPSPSFRSIPQPCRLVCEITSSFDWPTNRWNCCWASYEPDAGGGPTEWMLLSKHSNRMFLTGTNCTDLSVQQQPAKKKTLVRTPPQGPDSVAVVSQMEQWGGGGERCSTLMSQESTTNGEQRPRFCHVWITDGAGEHETDWPSTSIYAPRRVWARSATSPWLGKAVNSHLSAHCIKGKWKIFVFVEA